MIAAAPCSLCADAADLAAGLAARQMAMLQRLAEIGMEIAEAAGVRARQLGQPCDAIGEAGGDTFDPALSFSRVARAVRLTIALQARLVAERAGALQAATKARAAQASQRRARLHRRLEQAIAADHPEDEAEALSSAAWERLTDTDDADLLDRPMAEIVARIARDLGLPPGPLAAPFAELREVFDPLRVADAADPPTEPVPPSPSPAPPSSSDLWRGSREPPTDRRPP